MNTKPEAKENAILSRIAWKIILVISFSVLVIQLALVSYIEKRIYQSELQKVLNQQARFTEANAIYMAELIFENNEDNIYLVLSTIAANPLIVGARLDYADGSDYIEVGEEPTNLVYEFDIKDIDDRDKLVSVGTLSTFATTSFIDDSRNERLFGIFALILIVFLVVFAVTVFAVQAFVGIPLKRITRAISNHKRVPDIVWNSHDEMGSVVKRLNFLHSTLHDQLTGLEQELSANERREAARIRSLVNASLEGILIFKENSVIDLNEPMAQLMGKDRETLIKSSVTALLNIDQQDFLQQPLLNGTRTGMVSFLSQQDGNQLPVEIYFNPLEDHPKADKVAVVRDISERVTAEKAMWHMAHFDSLTELPNRRYFSELLESAILKARDADHCLTVAYLDLDNFKFINDSRGHTVGDRLLCGIASSLKQTLGSERNCARLGGDEFAILIEEDAQDETVIEILDKVFSDILNGPHCQEWSNIFSVSIGASTLQGKALDTGELLTRADLALYKAKESGRARICFYSDILDVELKRARLIVEKLVAALEQDQLELYYQPQILSDGSLITGFEALLRWHDPELGRVSPVEIVTIAESEGMVLQLGRWVMTRACKEAVNWPEHIRLAVNLSPMELADDGLPDFVASCLENTGLPASRLEIEITETALVSDFGKAATLLSVLKEMGIMIALDDFGTGYSSLSMLQDFPFDRIKIDRSFVSNLGFDKSKASIVASIIDLGARLDLDVIAEGVETENDRTTLRNFGCRECQGYLISRPVPPTELFKIIDQYPQIPSERDTIDILDWKKSA